MGELVKAVFTAPLATLFIVAGLLFLLIAAVGNISGKIEPGDKARILSGILGLILICIGLVAHVMEKAPDIPTSPSERSAQEKAGQPAKAPQPPADELLPSKSGNGPNEVSTPTKEDWLMCNQCALTGHRHTSVGSDWA